MFLMMMIMTRWWFLATVNDEQLYFTSSILLMNEQEFHVYERVYKCRCDGKIQLEEILFLDTNFTSTFLSLSFAALSLIL